MFVFTQIYVETVSKEKFFVKLRENSEKLCDKIRTKLEIPKKLNCLISANKEQTIRMESLSVL